MSDETLHSDRYGPVLVVRLGTTYNSLSESLVEHVEQFMLKCADQPETKHLVVDMSETDYFGSRFIEALFRTYNRMKRKGGKFALSSLRPQPEEVIRISKLDTVWLMFSNVEEAVRELGGDPVPQC